MEINLKKLELSVSKVRDLIDITLENLNKTFLVDNFTPHNTLKNTPLRNEFNQLCKNKAESKTMDEKSLSFENKKYLPRLSVGCDSICSSGLCWIIVNNPV